MFDEDFNVLDGKLPANWFVERNSSLPITAWEGHEGSFDLLSAGNKYIPVIPDVADFRIDMLCSANYKVAGEFSFTLTFHYDMYRREGDAVRISCNGTPVNCTVEFGRVADNIFTPSKTFSHEALPMEKVLSKMSVALTCVGRKACVEFAGIADSFEFGEAQEGKLCLSREHFLDLFNVSGFKVTVPKLPACIGSKSLRATLPIDAIPFPITCVFQFEDYGNCVIGNVTLDGGVRDTPPGEGDYHVMRADFLTNPYVKVLSEGTSRKFTLFQGDAILAQDEMTPAYFYTLMHRRPPWPMERKIAFIKPQGDLFFAVGADRCLNTTTMTTALEPGETVIDSDGRQIYSGKAISEADSNVVFRSQEDKEIIGLLPKDDPRYDLAVAFAKKNHYFLSGESIEFTLEVSSRKALPMEYEVTLENVFLDKLRTVSATVTFKESELAGFTVNTATIRCEDLAGLAEGVYHLRVRGTDATGVPIEDYCAFEVMGRGADALPPPLVSGLPFLYDSRTETRGLQTDSFDPWHTACVDEGHYMACANFLPAVARANRIAPTVHAYHREWFLWLASRCSNAPMMADNKDLIAEADYVHNKEELRWVPLFTRSCYGGGSLPGLLEFIRRHPDDRYDYGNIRELERLVAEGKGVDSASTSAIINGGRDLNDPELSAANFEVLAKYHWQEWLEHRNRYMADKLRKSVEWMRKLQPKVKYSA
ncbi:MAG: hypothetical protein J5833_09300, partial [Victivallales bacterium]|nr:hypothetical protein [Victivallales bacterium]